MSDTTLCRSEPASARSTDDPENQPIYSDLDELLEDELAEAERLAEWTAADEEYDRRRDERMAERWREREA